MNDSKYTDQADELRKLVKHQESAHKELQEKATVLPPRSEVHKNKRDKIVKLKIKFPLVRLLLILFIIIVLLAVTSPIWLEKFI